MLLVQAYLAPSDIEGLGVFSTTDIKRGQLIWRFDSRIDRMISLSELAHVDDRLGDFLKRYTYTPPQRRNVCVLDGDEGRYMNHSDTPNTDFTGFEQGHAIRDIKAGEELTCDYRQFDVNAHVFMPSITPLGRQLTETLDLI